MKKIPERIKSKKDLAKPQWIYLKNTRQKLRGFKPSEEMEQERDLGPQRIKLNNDIHLIA